MSLFNTVSNEMPNSRPQTTTQINLSNSLVYFPYDIEVVEPETAGMAVGMIVDTNLAEMHYHDILDCAGGMMVAAELAEGVLTNLKTGNADAKFLELQDCDWIAMLAADFEHHYMRNFVTQGRQGVSL
jgi:hypothetical protein